MEKHKPRGIPPPSSYQHLLAQLDKDEDAGVHHPLTLDRPVLEGQVLAFLIQEDPQLFLGDKGRAQGWTGPTVDTPAPHNSPRQP